jgi:hypothetical protein
MPSLPTRPAPAQGQPAARQPLAAVTGTARWLIRPGTDPDALPCLRITATSALTGRVSSGLYNLHVLIKGAGLSEEVIAYALTNLDSGKQYHVNVQGPRWTCDCGDATFRDRPCKHALALHVALEAVGLLPGTPEPSAQGQGACGTAFPDDDRLDLADLDALGGVA